MRKILCTGLLLIMQANASVLESDLEGGSQAKADMLLIDADFEEAFREGGDFYASGYSLCCVGENCALIFQHGGSGMYVTRARVYARHKNGWVSTQSFLMSTGAAEKTPAKVSLKDSILSIIARDGSILEKIDLNIQ